MSRIETLRNDAAKYLTALYADESLANAVALANVANQMIAVLSGSSSGSEIRFTIDALPGRLKDFTEETKESWLNGEWHELEAGRNFAKDPYKAYVLVRNFFRAKNTRFTSRTCGKSIRFRALPSAEVPQ